MIATIVLSMLTMLGANLTAGFTSTRPSDDSPGSGAQLLVLPKRGSPISFEQTEEHSPEHADGTLVAEYRIVSETYRDSAGRVRMESETRDGADHILNLYAQVIDPVGGYRAILLNAHGIAYRLPFPISSDSRLVLLDAADGQESLHKWKVRTEDAGRRTVEGIEFQGTRNITTAEDDPRLTTTFEQWYSDELKLVGAVDRSGPDKAYTIRIRNVHRQEPDPKLFAIPAGYKIIDVQCLPGQP
jgi:hypothetical protein